MLDKLEYMDFLYKAGLLRKAASCYHYASRPQASRRS